MNRHPKDLPTLLEAFAAEEGAAAQLSGAAVDAEYRSLRAEVRRRRAVRWGATGLSAAAAVAVFAVGVHALSTPDEPTPPATQSPTQEPTPAPSPSTPSPTPTPTPTPTATPTEEPLAVTVDALLPEGATLVTPEVWERVSDEWLLVRHQGFQDQEMGEVAESPAVLYLVSPTGELFEVPVDLEEIETALGGGLDQAEIVAMDWDVRAREALVTYWGYEEGADAPSFGASVLDLVDGTLTHLPAGAEPIGFGRDGTVVSTTAEEVLVTDRTGEVLGRAPHIGEADRLALDLAPDGAHVSFVGPDGSLRVLQVPDLAPVTLPTIEHPRLVEDRCEPGASARFGAPGRLVVVCSIVPDPDSAGVQNYQPAWFEVPIDGGAPRLLLRGDLVDMYELTDVLLVEDRFFVHGSLETWAESEHAGRYVVAEVAPDGESFGQVTPVWPYHLGPAGRALVDLGGEADVPTSGSLTWIDLRDGSRTEVLTQRAPNATNVVAVAGS